MIEEEKKMLNLLNCVIQDCTDQIGYLLDGMMPEAGFLLDRYLEAESPTGRDGGSE